MGVPLSRPLRPEERALAGSAIATTGADAPRWREQLAGAVVVGACECGCGTIEFGFPGEEARSDGRPVRILADGVYDEGEDGESRFDLILFAKEGRLFSLEIVCYSDAPPKAYPSPGRVKWLAGPHGPEAGALRRPDSRA